MTSRKRENGTFYDRDIHSLAPENVLLTPFLCSPLHYDAIERQDRPPGRSSKRRATSDSSSTVNLAPAACPSFVPGSTFVRTADRKMWPLVGISAHWALVIESATLWCSSTLNLSFLVGETATFLPREHILCFGGTVMIIVIISINASTAFVDFCHFLGDLMAWDEERLKIYVLLSRWANEISGGCVNAHTKVVSLGSVTN